MSNSSQRPAPGESNRFVRFEDLDPEEARRMRDLVAEAERATAPPSLRARRDRDAHQPVRYAIADQPLAHGAAAAVVRDARSGFPRLIVLSPGADDAALFLADAALDHDEAAHPAEAGGRLVFVTSDRRLIRQVGGGPEPDVTLDIVLPSSPGRELTAPLLRATERGREVGIAGIGRVRLADG